MNKQDRQNKTIKREREILIPCQPPSSPSANVTMGGSSTPCRNQGPHRPWRTTSWAQEGSEGTPGARGKSTSEFRIVPPPRRTRFLSRAGCEVSRPCGRQAPRQQQGVARVPSRVTHTHSQQPQAAPNLRLLEFRGEYQGLRSLRCGYFWGPIASPFRFPM